MRKIISILVLALLFNSCSKDEVVSEPRPFPTSKVIEKITLSTITSNSAPKDYETRFEYDSIGAVSKIAYYIDAEYVGSYTFTYENAVPISAMYEYVSSGDPPSKINFTYTNERYSSTYYTFYNTLALYDYNLQTTQYSSYDNNLKFILNDNDDIALKEIYGSSINYNFETQKKGPLYNVKNKKWISTLWFTSAFDALTNNVITTYPINSVVVDNIVGGYNNTYDSDGFVIKATSLTNNGSYNTEIEFIYTIL